MPVVTHHLLRLAAHLLVVSRSFDGCGATATDVDVQLEVVAAQPTSIRMIQKNRRSLAPDILLPQALSRESSG